jgi:hypothetical protein
MLLLSGGVPLEEVPQSCDVRLGHLQRLELAELVVRIQTRNDLPQSIERLVQAVHPATLSCVRGQSAPLHDRRRGQAVSDDVLLPAAAILARLGGSFGEVCEAVRLGERAGEAVEGVDVVGLGWGLGEAVLVEEVEGVVVGGLVGVQLVLGVLGQVGVAGVAVVVGLHHVHLGKHLHRVLVITTGKGLER